MIKIGKQRKMEIFSNCISFIIKQIWSPKH